MLFLSYINVFLTLLGVALAGKYNTEVYSVNPKSERSLLSKGDALLIRNVGLVDLEVTYYYGVRERKHTEVTWDVTFIVKPGKAKRVTHYLESYKFKSFLVKNFQETKGLAHTYALGYAYAEYDDAYDSPWDLDQNSLAQICVATAVAHVPFISDALIVAANFFWPQEKEPSIWDQIKEQVLDTINEKISELTLHFMKTELEIFQRRIKSCAREVDSPNITTTVARHYANIAEDLIGMELKFIGTDMHQNFNALPLYAGMINLKIVFYQYGIMNRERIGLEKEFDDRLRYYIYDMIYNPRLNVLDHIIKTCEDKLEYNYIYTYPETLFKAMSGAREYCAINALEFIPTWKLIAKDALAPKAEKIPILVYSNQFGRNTATQSYEIIALESITYSPKIIEGVINEVTKINVFLTKKNYIAGLDIHYQNKDVEFTGASHQDNVVTVDYKGRHLVNLTAYGTGQINGLSFAFADGKVQDVGKKEGKSHVFQLNCHYIVGFFGTKGVFRVDLDQMANIAVSYTFGPCY